MILKELDLGDYAIDECEGASEDLPNKHERVEGTSLQEDERRRSFGARPKHAHLHRIQ
jgi:hypothetical protein